MESNITVKKGKPYPLGMSVTGSKELNFAAALSGKGECGVILYPIKGGEQIRIPFGRDHKIGNIYCMTLHGISSAVYAYNFYAGSEIITDPYAGRILGNEAWGVKTEAVLCGCDRKKTFDWGDDTAPMTPLCDSLLYLVHVRGFTRHSSSGVKKKGTFAGIAEKIPYMKELGITAVELMPAYEFAELEEPAKNVQDMTEMVTHCLEQVPEEKTTRINYWGFKKGYYFAPKASYAASKDPVTEFKRLVKALHENGLELILQFYFPRQIKGAYILDVLKYWVCEYHVDGFHLMGEQIPIALIASEPLFSNTKLFYQDFPCQEIFDTADVPAYKNLACYRDDFLYDMRRFLKGDEDMLDTALNRLKENPAQTGVIHYMASYDGFSLADMVMYERRHNEENGEYNRDGVSYNASWNCGCEGETQKQEIVLLRQKQMRNAMLLLLTAQGTPMIAAGDEFCHSRKGNNNAYCQDNDINWLNWELAEKNSAFLSFVRSLIALRREHPVLHKPDALSTMDYIACGYPELSYHGENAWRLERERISREAGVMYCGHYARIDRKQEDAFFYIAYNMHWVDKEFALPKLPDGLHWEVVFDSALEEQEKGHIIERTVCVGERSIQVLQSFGKPVKEGTEREGITAF